MKNMLSLVFLCFFMLGMVQAQTECKSNKNSPLFDPLTVAMDDYCAPHTNGKYFFYAKLTGFTKHQLKFLVLGSMGQDKSYTGQEVRVKLQGKPCLDAISLAANNLRDYFQNHVTDLFVVDQFYYLSGGSHVKTDLFAFHFGKFAYLSQGKKHTRLHNFLKKVENNESFLNCAQTCLNSAGYFNVAPTDKVALGDTIKSPLKGTKLGCFNCTCIENKNIKCVKDNSTTCPPTNCPSGILVLPDDSCCPVCQQLPDFTQHPCHLQACNVAHGGGELLAPMSPIVCKFSKNIAAHDFTKSVFVQNANGLGTPGDAYSVIRAADAKKYLIIQPVVPFEGSIRISFSANKFQCGGGHYLNAKQESIGMTINYPVTARSPAQVITATLKDAWDLTGLPLATMHETLNEPAEEAAEADSSGLVSYTDLTYPNTAIQLRASNASYRGGPVTGLTPISIPPTEPCTYPPIETVVTNMPLGATLNMGPQYVHCVAQSDYDAPVSPVGGVLTYTESDVSLYFRTTANVCLANCGKFQLEVAGNALFGSDGNNPGHFVAYGLMPYQTGVYTSNEHGFQVFSSNESFDDLNQARKKRFPTVSITASVGPPANVYGGTLKVTYQDSRPSRVPAHDSWLVQRMSGKTHYTIPLTIMSKVSSLERKTPSVKRYKDGTLLQVNGNFQPVKGGVLSVSLEGIRSNKFVVDTTVNCNSTPWDPCCSKGKISRCMVANRKPTRMVAMERTYELQGLDSDGNLDGVNPFSSRATPLYEQRWMRDDGTFAPLVLPKDNTNDLLGSRVDIVVCSCAMKKNQVILKTIDVSNLADGFDESISLKWSTKETVQQVGSDLADSRFHMHIVSYGDIILGKHTKYDPDGDGWPSIVELCFGTDPLNVDSRPNCNNPPGFLHHPSAVTLL